jgi:hypothetical protein
MKDSPNTGRRPGGIAIPPPRVDWYQMMLEMPLQLSWSGVFANWFPAWKPFVAVGTVQLHCWS